MAIKLNQLKTTSGKKRTRFSGIGLTAFSFKNAGFLQFNKGLSIRQKADFYGELAILIEAGLDLKKAFDLLIANQRKKHMKVLLVNILEKLIHGQSLSQALKSKDDFTVFEIQSLKIGEESGRLVPVLKKLTSFFENSIKFRQQAVQAFSYPAVVLFVAFGVLYFLLNYLVPMFSSMYAQMDKGLPPMTQFIVDLSVWLGNYAPIIMLVVILIVLISWMNKKKTWFRKLTSRILTAIPLFGNMTQKIYLARYCDSMAFLLEAKVPLVKTIGLTSKMVDFYPIDSILPQVQKDILAGKAFYESIRPYRVFPPQLLALVQVGEEAGQLEMIFNKLAIQYQTELEQKTKTLSTLLEPLLILVLSTIVGIVLVAMYMPIFKMVSEFGF